MINKIMFAMLCLMIVSCSDDTDKKKTSPTVQKFYEEAGKIKIKGLNDSNSLDKKMVGESETDSTDKDKTKENALKKYQEEAGKVKIKGLN